MTSKVLVTGGAGFIGSHLVDVLIKEGLSVSILDNLSTGSAKNLNKKATFYKFSIDEKEKVGNLLKGNKFHYIYHLAAEPTVVSTLKKSTREFQTTINGIINLLSQGKIKDLKKFIYFSSAATYSKNTDLPVSETGSINPISYYGLSKLTGEFLTKTLASTNNISWVIFRPANVYGPRQRTNGEAGVIASFIGDLSKGQQIKIFGNGKKTRDFIFVNDIVNACLLAVKKDLSGIYNLGTTKQTSIIDLTKKLQKIADKNTSIKFLKNRDGEIHNSSLDSKKIRRLGWLPRINLDQGLETTWKYFNKQ